jgi:hypothetical protein
MTVDWQATKYIGLTIDWDYPRRKANIHMPGTSTKLLFGLNIKSRTKFNDRRTHML